MDFTAFKYNFNSFFLNLMYCTMYYVLSTIYYILFYYFIPNLKLTKKLDFYYKKKKTRV